MAAFASQTRRPRARRSACCRRRCDNANTRARRRSTRAFPPTRAFAREILPGVRETPATIDAALPVDRAGPQAASAKRARRPRQRRSARRPPTSRSVDRRDAQAAAAGRPASPSASTNVILPTGDIKIAGRPADHRRRELQGVLVHDGRPRRRGPELRRQRHVRALPAGRRRPDDLHRQRRPLTGDTLFGNAVADAAGHAAGVHRAAPAVQARRRPATPDRSPTSTARRPARPTAAARHAGALGDRALGRAARRPLPAA